GPPAGARRVAARGSLLVPTRGGRPAEPPGLAVRAAVLAARRRVREGLGIRPRRAPLLRARRRVYLLVAPCARPLAGGRARRRSVLSDAVPRRAVDRAPPRARLVPPAGDGARARAASVRSRRSRAGCDPALRAAPPRARRDPARAGLRL